MKAAKLGDTRFIRTEITREYDLEFRELLAKGDFRSIVLRSAQLSKWIGLVACQRRVFGKDTYICFQEQALTSSGWEDMNYIR